jgi:hypothetical protein
MKMEAARFSETLVSYRNIIQYYSTEDIDFNHLMLTIETLCDKRPTK